MTQKDARFFASLRYAPGIASLNQRWLQWRRVYRLSKKVKAFRTQLEALGSLDAAADTVLQSKSFWASQQKTEIVQLLNLLQNLQPKYLCEIGAWRGGTLALFCQAAAPDAHVLSIDLNYTPKRIRAFRHFARSRQQITCLKADSHAPTTVNQVERWLHQHPLDFLLIDGDHSLTGVTSDFEMYAPYVRSGGIVAFHDIVPDYQTRYGIRTNHFTGQVPEFWTGLKRRFPASAEFVEDAEQDGYGIGVLYWQGMPESRQAQ